MAASDRQGRPARGVGTPKGTTWTSRGLGLVGLAIAITTLVVALGMILSLRDQTIATQRREVRNLGTVLAEQTARYMQVADLVLRELQSRTAILAIATPEEFRARLAGTDTHELLRARLQNLPLANAFLLIDSQGNVLNTSRSYPAPHINSADRDFFQHFAAQDDQGAFFSEPLVSRVTGRPTLYMARRINGPGGQFLGLAMSAIDLGYLTAFYQGIGMPPGETVTLLRRDGMVLTRYPDTTGERGRRIPANSPWHRLTADAGGTYRSTGALSGRPAVVSVRPLVSYPLVVDVAMEEDAALAVWRQQAWIVGIAGCAVALGFAVLFRVLAQQLRRREAETAAAQATAAALRQSEQLLADNARLLEATLEHMDQGLMVIARDRSIPVLNRRAIELLGLPPDLVAGHPHFETLLSWQWQQGEFAGSDEQFRDFVRRALLLQGPRLYERVRPNGRVLEVRTTPLPDGEAIRTYTDVTERNAASAALEQAKERAEAASRAKSEFLANMSHELRTPLHAIIGFAELIRDQTRGRDASAYVEFAKDIHASGQHLLELINEVLDLSKIEAGRYELVSERLDLDSLLRSCLGMLALRIREGGVRLLGENCAAGVMVLADRRAMKQVLVNLLGNAVKFTPPGGTVTLQVEAAAPAGDHMAGGLALAISDTGIGIEPDALAQLCEPFRQADASISRRFGGSGLGLSISQRLMVLHGGTLDIASTVGRGTTVRVVFPAERVVAGRVAAAAST